MLLFIDMSFSYKTVLATLAAESYLETKDKIYSSKKLCNIISSVFNLKERDKN